MEGEIKRVECTWLKDVSGREILASVMAVFGFDACSLCFSGLVAAEPNARATLRQPVMDIRGSRSARKWPKTQLALFTALFCQQQMSYVWSLTALNCAFRSHSILALPPHTRYVNCTYERSNKTSKASLVVILNYIFLLCFFFRKTAISLLCFSED